MKVPQERLNVRGEHKRQKRSRIIAAAARVFAQKGFSGTVMADIALEADMGKGTLYEYFDSKEDLFFAVFEWFVKKTGAEARVNASALGGSATERLEALSESLIKAGLDLEELYTLVMEFWAASSTSQIRERFKEAFRESYGEFRGIVSALLRDGIDRGEFRPEVDDEAVAAALVGTWDALLLQAWFDDSFRPAETARHFMSALIRGLAAQGQQKDQDRLRADD